MSKREEAREILKSLGLPKAQQNERSSLTLLALAGLSEKTPWVKTQRPAAAHLGHHGLDEGEI
jgi:hypothetical protein